MNSSLLLVKMYAILMLINNKFVLIHLKLLCVFQLFQSIVLFSLITAVNYFHIGVITN